MGKRSVFERVPRDFYPTPVQAIEPLLSYLPRKCHFIEPCAGDGALIQHLEAQGHECVCAYDIEPKAEDIIQQDALSFKPPAWADCFITNPPWSRDILHPLITHLSDQFPTWLLIDADWMHTKQSIPFLPRVRSVISVGRLKWIPGSLMTGKDNCVWMLFDKPEGAHAIFHGRTK